MAMRPPLTGPEFPFEELLPLIEIAHTLTSDSRLAKPGVIFAAYPGEDGDGRDWIGDALSRGASGLIWDPEDYHDDPEWTVPHLAVPGLRWEISRIASFFYGDPSWEMKTVGVTGTNGKTSSTHWIAQALTAVNIPCGLVGTLGAGLMGALEPTGFTTPTPIELQAGLMSLKKLGAQAVALEVSSHGLAQGRVDGVHFDIAVFTNLSHDHLDYHGTLEAYGEAKALLFHSAELRKAIINIDDAFGLSLYQKLVKEGVPALAFSTKQKPITDGQEIYCSYLKVNQSGSEFDLRLPNGDVIGVKTKLLGLFNVSNLIGVAAVLLEMGVASNQLPQLLSQLEAPPGRMQGFESAKGVKVVVDFAHTPDALGRVLDTLRIGLPKDNRLFCVFGCGGERDQSKRPKMGAIAEEKADVVILTSDNPRSEDPIQILRDISKGMLFNPYGEMLDRKLAITQAILLAKPGDVVLVAGKGHEKFQEIDGSKIPFSDEEIVLNLINQHSDDTEAGEAQ
jgi:UDP-N-acetylmuramoyl-L-alanyl-D-glutamate--2,6-diaminopimelate ligase